MYAVVGCRDCGAFWVIEGRPERTQCPRCETAHPTDRLKRFVETDDPDRAREARGALLAAAAGYEELYERLDRFEALEPAADRAGPDPDELLAAVGVDPDAAAAAAERDRSSSTRREVVERAIDLADPPTEDAIVEQAQDRGIDPATVRRLLDAMHADGTVVRDDGVYRRL